MGEILVLYNYLILWNDIKCKDRVNNILIYILYYDNILDCYIVLVFM